MSTGVEGQGVVRRGRDGAGNASSAVARLDPVTLLFIAAAALSAALLLGLGSRLTFLLDDWSFLVYRRGFNADAILAPHGENIAVGPALVYQALLHVFGMDSALPFRIVSVATFITSASLLFVWLRRRVDAWLALFGATIVLFLGAAWEDLLWAFQVGYFASMSGGIAALLALERDDRRGDLIACACLTVAVLFSSLGLPFMVAAAVAIAIGRREAWLSRAFVVVVPGAVFALWWLGWGSDANSWITARNVVTAPLFLVDGVAAALSALFGLATPRDESLVGILDWGRPLLGAAVVLVGWRFVRLRRVPPWLWVVGAAALTFWLLAAFNEKAGRDPLVSRYQYIGVIFVLMAAAELLRGVRVTRPAILAAGAVTALAVASNISYLHQSYESYRLTSQIERADLAALEIARPLVDPAFRLDEAVAQTAYVGIEAGPYFDARDDFGTPAYSEEELLGAPDAARSAADTVLGAALGLQVVPLPSGSEPCGAGAAESVQAPGAIDLPAGGAVIEVAPGSGAVDLRMRRFAERFSINVGSPAPGRPQQLAIPGDASSRPWQLGVFGDGEVSVCPLSDGAAG